MEKLVSKIFLKYYFLIFFKNYFRNLFLHCYKRATNGKTHYILHVCNMPKFVLVFAVSLTPETPNFGTFGGVAHPL